MNPTVYILIPLDDQARSWIDENIDAAATWFGGGVVVEHRFISDILEGIKGDGLEGHFSLRS